MWFRNTKLRARVGLHSSSTSAFLFLVVFVIMRLTSILFRWKKKPPGGNMWRGKYRLYKEVKPVHLNNLRREFELEEKNMFYIRHPYLTAEQSQGHAQALGYYQNYIHGKKLQKLNWRENSYLGDRLGYLKINDKWE